MTYQAWKVRDALRNLLGEDKEWTLRGSEVKDEADFYSKFFVKTGVDEYLCKPFEPEELLLRIENIIKRRTVLNIEANSIILGDCIFNSKDHVLTFKENKIKLTFNESKVLFHLYKNSNIAVKREDLANILKISDRSVDVIIKRLREKINKIPNHQNLLLTSRGIGYKMEIETL